MGPATSFISPTMLSFFFRRATGHQHCLCIERLIELERTRERIMPNDVPAGGVAFIVCTGDLFYGVVAFPSKSKGQIEDINASHL